ncbi:MAG: hypothetical protein MW690_000026 [Methanophagales archaeon]|nr:hypothetical protein [Methanophagales archaeon]
MSVSREHSELTERQNTRGTHVFACLRVCSAGSRRQEARGGKREDGVG